MSSVAVVILVGLTSALTAKSENGRNVNNTMDRACVESLGCFDIGEPWSRQQRVPQPSQPQGDTTVLFFYTRENTENPYLITTYPVTNVHRVPFDGSRPTAVIIHDRRQNATMEWMHNIKYFYLLKINSNVFLVDYSEACKGGYIRSVANARVVGRLISRSLKYLITQRNLRPKSIHLIGHGLGAHIASYVAKDIPGISRLTALDPLRPLFEGSDRSIRLDRRDASFVEVIHTNAIPFEGYGMVEPHGHVDFYFNDGGNQPGCSLPPGFPTITKLWDIIELPLQYFRMKNSCNQDRAYDYLVEAYNSYSDCLFWGHRVTVPPMADTFIGSVGRYILSLFATKSRSRPEISLCTEDDCLPFSYDTFHYRLRGVFVVKTNSKPPYCIPDLVL